MQFESLNKTRFTELGEQENQDIFDLSEGDSEMFVEANGREDLASEDFVVMRESIRQIQEDGERRKGRLKAGILVCMCICGMGLAIVGLMKVVHNSIQNREKERVQATKTLIENASKPTKAPWQGASRAARRALEDYFEANTLEEAAPYMSKAPHVKAVLAKYWEPLRYENIALIPQATKYLAESRTAMYLFRCQRQGGVDLYPVYMTEGKDYPLIDWQYAHQIEEMSLQDIFANDYVGDVKVRVQITTDDYYNFGYEDMTSQSFFLSHPFEPQNLSLRLPCYIETASPQYKYLAQYFKLKPKWLHQCHPKGVSLEQLEDIMSNDKVTSQEQKPFVRKTSRMILEIEVLEGLPKVALIKRVISTDLVDYFRRYQYPYLN